ncbi:MAG: hypothetical protein HC781_01020 [Leptolyngbyaceae cyanobacterium CSU_1_4]|nr:hypothetical protein [Leptolyngbyaceae cyanobacterium CSU_1_4]
MSGGVSFSMMAISVAVSLVASPVTVSWGAGSNASTELGILSNGDVVTRAASGNRISVE